MKNFFDKIINKLVDSFGVSKSKADSTPINRNIKIGVISAILIVSYAVIKSSNNDIKDNSRPLPQSINVESYNITEHERKVDSTANAMAEKQAEDERIQQEASIKLKQINAAKTSASFSKKAPSSSRSVYTRGPRGGCYYLSSSGKKVYVDRDLCD